jgi:hypothetical protein
LREALETRIGHIQSDVRYTDNDEFVFDIPMVAK